MTDKHGEESLRQAVEAIDVSQIDTRIVDQYPAVPTDEIRDAYEFDKSKGALLRVVDSVLSNMRGQAAGEVRRLPETHQAGWNIAIQTPNGYVGLSSGWLRERFYVGFPKGQERLVPDDLVEKTLGVEPAVPVTTNRHDNSASKRLWAKFYGRRQPEGGRVWVDYDDRESNGMHFPVVTEKGNLESVYYGHNRSNSIATCRSSQFSEQAPDAPTNDPIAVQDYREKFIHLTTSIAYCLGGPLSMTVAFELPVMVPEDLAREGYESQWIKGVSGVRDGWSNDVIKGTKNDETVMLKSGNSLVPWSTMRKMGIPQESREPYKLAQFIIEDALYF